MAQWIVVLILHPLPLIFSYFTCVDLYPDLYSKNTNLDPLSCWMRIKIRSGSTKLVLVVWFHRWYLSGTLFVTNKPWWFLKLFETNVGCREQNKTKAADCLKPIVLSTFILKSWMGCHMSGTVMVILSLNSSDGAKGEYREREKKIIWIFFCSVYCSCLYLICCGFPVLLKEPRPDPNHRRHFRFIVPRGGRCAVSLPLATESRAGWSPHPRANRQPTVPGGRAGQPSACRTSPRQHEQTANL